MHRHLVTGGAGFIGSHIVEALEKEGDRVVVVDDLSSGSRDNLTGTGSGVELMVGDVCDPALMKRACRGVSTVFHLAALTSVPESLEAPLAFNRVDVEGTLVTLVEARRAGAGRFLLAGSCAAYGEGSPRPLCEEDTGTPLSPYAAAKAAAEAYCLAFRAAYGFDAIVLRFFNVFGPRQRADSPYAAVVPRFLSALDRGEKPKVFGTGEQTRDLVFVEDVASACIAVARAGGPLSPVYNVGTGRSVRVLDVLERAASSMDARAEADFLPPRPGEILHSSADVSRLDREVGFRAAVSFEEGMERTARWFRKRKDR